MAPSVVDGGLWWKAKNPPYKHTIVAYGAAMVHSFTNFLRRLSKNPPAMVAPFNYIDDTKYIEKVDSIPILCFLG